MSWLLGTKKKEPENAVTAPTPQIDNNAASSDSSRSHDDLQSHNSVTSVLQNSTSDLDPARLHPLAGLGQSLDYLLIEDDQLSALPGGQGALPSRGWSDDLCYGTGTTYLTALGIGGIWGAVESLRRPMPQVIAGSMAQSAPSTKLRINTLLNGVTRRGPFLGNSAGVIALTYNAFNSTIGHYRGKHDVLNSVASGAIAGALFKSTRCVVVYCLRLKLTLFSVQRTPADGHCVGLDWLRCIGMVWPESCHHVMVYSWYIEYNLWISLCLPLSRRHLGASLGSFCLLFCRRRYFEFVCRSGNFLQIARYTRLVFLSSLFHFEFVT